MGVSDVITLLLEKLDDLDEATVIALNYITEKDMSVDLTVTKL